MAPLHDPPPPFAAWLLRLVMIAVLAVVLVVTRPQPGPPSHVQVPASVFPVQLSGMPSPAQWLPCLEFGTGLAGC